MSERWIDDTAKTYSLESYAEIGNVPPNDLVLVESLIRGVNFVKAPREAREIIGKAINLFLEREWMRHNEEGEGSISRKDAPIVFLPGQDNLARADVDWGIDEGGIIRPSTKIFDQAEWVAEGMTRERLNSDLSKAVYIAGRIQGSNDLFNLIQVSKRLRELGYQEITLAVSCLGWTRQDYPDETQGQPDVIAAVMETISHRVDRAAVLKPHSEETSRNALINELLFFAFSGWRYLVDNLLEEKEEMFTLDQKVVVVGPDIGAYGESAKVAVYLSKVLSQKHGQEVTVELVSLNKERDPVVGTVIFSPLTEEQKVKLRNCLVIAIDDTIASAQTSEKMMELVTNTDVNEQPKSGDDWPGAKGVILLSTHASLQGRAIKRLTNPKFLDVRFTDSRDFLNQPPADGNIKVLDCMPLIAEFVRADREEGFNPWRYPYFQGIVC